MFNIIWGRYRAGERSHGGWDSLRGMQSCNHATIHSLHSARSELAGRSRRPMRSCAMRSVVAIDTWQIATSHLALRPRRRRPVRWLDKKELLRNSVSCLDKGRYDGGLVLRQCTKRDLVTIKVQTRQDYSMCCGESDIFHPPRGRSGLDWS
jgi:hypothetical protein